ncbi:hypothetical protein P691DRAFT_272935 [Macrolepiota fuliginosa MF-IS2]|uniref:Uncharacterized protein n=1 Tax=Macrolepiota fuliginosa MF-IS2 TaxID=1400762 RepID=A0A9P5WXV3_9AGAR|nr:hypothetical protein P691DRAFT_272935 [Macrolepiota fuliginosa MF-IS2]
MMHVVVNTADFLEKLLPLPKGLDLSLLVDKLKSGGLYKDKEWVGLRVDSDSSRSGGASWDYSSKTEKALKGGSSSRSGGTLQDGGSLETGKTSQNGGSMKTGGTSQGGNSLKGHKTSKRGDPSRNVGALESQTKPRDPESKMYGPLAKILGAINEHACVVDQKSADRLHGEWIACNPNSKSCKPDFIFTSTTNARALEDGSVSSPEDIDDEPEMYGDTMQEGGRDIEDSDDTLEHSNQEVGFPSATRRHHVR